MFRRQTSAMLASFGLFFQLLVVGFHIPPALAMAGLATASSSIDGAYRTITICTINGLQTITLDERGEPVNGRAPLPLTGNTCPVCLTLSGDRLALAGHDFLIHPIILMTANRELLACQPDHFHPLVSLPRGPPFA